MTGSSYDQAIWSKNTFVRQWVSVRSQTCDSRHFSIEIESNKDDMSVIAKINGNICFRWPSAVRIRLTQTVAYDRASCKLAESVADSMAKKVNALAQRLHAARLAQLGEHRSAEREVAGSNPGRTNNQGLKKTGETMLAVLSWDDRVIGRWRKTFGLVSFILLLSDKSEGDVKTHTTVRKEGGSFLDGVVYLSRITYHSYHGLWVDYCKLINGLIAAATGALCAEVLANS